ncbi:hypothetical protein [Erythrobacter sp. MTPC3]|uniref:hypothetical protein n=1 Tax=Erythrobacter sp. MTPC3 TaxID=3056564 RepID=UPI0036F2376D
MIEANLPEVHDLHTVLYTLERQLIKLDAMGAGIAAIHVNAAIEQLRSNIEIVNEVVATPFDPTLISLHNAY